MFRMIEFLFATVVLLFAQAPPSSYDTAKTAAVKTCDAIDANEYQTGLALNPDGYRSYYGRSQCFQNTAEQFRDRTLCDRVRQRRALLSSSWGYSPGNCRTLVGEAVDADRKEIEEIKRQYLAGSMVLGDFRIERNGNGRDYDVIPSFEGADGHGYMIAIEILPPGGKPVAVHTERLLRGSAKRAPAVHPAAGNQGSLSRVRAGSFVSGARDGHVHPAGRWRLAIHERRISGNRLSSARANAHGDAGDSILSMPAPSPKPQPKPQVDPRAVRRPSSRPSAGLRSFVQRSPAAATFRGSFWRSRRNLEPAQSIARTAADAAACSPSWPCAAARPTWIQNKYGAFVLMASSTAAR